MWTARKLSVLSTFYIKILTFVNCFAIKEILASVFSPVTIRCLAKKTVKQSIFDTFVQIIKTETVLVENFDLVTTKTNHNFQDTFTETC